MSKWPPALIISTLEPKAHLPDCGFYYGLTCGETGSGYQWTLGITLAIASTTVSFPSLYATAEEWAAALVTINNPGTTALVSAVYGQDYTYGIMTGHQLLAMTGVIAALMSILTLVRHTGLEEATGRAELVRYCFLPWLL